MKKYIFPAILLVIVAGSALIGYGIIAPSRAAARDLEAINGLTIGQSEADLLKRSAFQKIELHCFGDMCMYSAVRGNELLHALHLAPALSLSTVVMVRNGNVIQVAVWAYMQGHDPISIAQASRALDECKESVCIVPRPKLLKLRQTELLIPQKSKYRTRYPEMVNTSCLSKIGGCKTYAELMPFTKALNLEAENTDTK